MPRRKRNDYLKYILALIIFIPFLLYAFNIRVPASLISISSVSIQGEPTTTNVVKSSSGTYTFYGKAYWVVTLVVDRWDQLKGYKVVIDNSTLSNAPNAQNYKVKKTVEIEIEPLPGKLSVPLKSFANYPFVPGVYGWWWDFSKIFDNLKSYQVPPLVANIYETPSPYSWLIQGGFVGNVTINGVTKSFSVANASAPISLDFGYSQSVVIRDLGYIQSRLTAPVFSYGLTIFPVSKDIPGAVKEKKDGYNESYYLLVAVPKEKIAQDYTNYWYGGAVDLFKSLDNAKGASGYVQPFTDAYKYNLAPGFIRREGSYLLSPYGYFWYHPRAPSFVTDAPEISIGTFLWQNQTLSVSDPRITQFTAHGSYIYSQIYYARPGQSLVNYIRTTYGLDENPAQWNVFDATPVSKWYIDTSKAALVLESANLDYYKNTITILIPFELVDTFSYNPGLSSFKIVSLQTDFGSKIIGGGKGQLLVTVQNTGDTMGSVDVITTSTNAYVSPDKATVTIPPGASKTVNFTVTVANVDATASITVALYDYMAKKWDEKSISFDIYKQLGITSISEAHFNPSTVKEGSSTTLEVHISSTSSFSGALKLSNFDTSVLKFDATTQSVSIASMTNDFVLKFKASVVGKFDKKTSVDVELYDDKGTKVSSYRAWLFYDEGTSQQGSNEKESNWLIIAIIVGVILVAVVLLSQRRSSLTTLILLLGGGGLLLYVLVAAGVISLAALGLTFLSLPNLSLGNIGSVPAYLVIAVMA
ncbi:MAG: hypothetical protein ACP5M7_09520, partial [Thermoproteota archaeon]